MIILIAIIYLWQGPVGEWQANRKKPKNFLAGLDAGKISGMEISNPAVSVKLEKDGDKWKISGTKGFYVKESIMESALSGLKDAVAAKMDIVGENKDNKNKFRTDDSGTKVVLTGADGTMAEFTVGDMTGDYSGTYVSPLNSDTTYSVKAGLSGSFTRADWYDKTIFAADKEKIDKIRFQYPNREFTLEKASSTNEVANGRWNGVSPYKFSVNQDKAAKILDIMSGLNAAEIPAQTFENTGLEKNNIIVEATGEGINNIIMIGDVVPDKNMYYAKRGDSDNIYLITKEQRDELEKQIWQLR